MGTGDVVGKARREHTIPRQLAAMTNRPRVLVLHGPNLNLLGKREPGLYGSETLGEIDRRLEERAAKLGLDLEAAQSNSEGGLVDLIQGAAGRAQGILINPAAYTHTSVAVRDALLAVELPAVEVHLSNPSAREEFRRTSLVSDVVLGTVSGFGSDSYLLALEGLAARLLDRA